MYPGTEELYDDELIGSMKRGTYLVNTARGMIANRDAVVRVLENGRWQATPATSGFPSPRHKAIHGAQCPAMG
jgi:formate dehydrogenase